MHAAPCPQIASKVEVYVSTGGEGAAATTYKRLGYLSFDSNERSNHQVRGEGEEGNGGGEGGGGCGGGGGLGRS